MKLPDTCRLLGTLLHFPRRRPTAGTGSRCRLFGTLHLPHRRPAGDTGSLHRPICALCAAASISCAWSLAGLAQQPPPVAEPAAVATADETETKEETGRAGETERQERSGTVAGMEDTAAATETAGTSAAGDTAGAAGTTGSGSAVGAGDGTGNGEAAGAAETAGAGETAEVGGAGGTAAAGAGGEPAPADTAPSARQLMEWVDDNQRAAADSAFNRLQLSTCRFGVRDGRITCAERPRVTALESVGKNYGPEGRDTRAITIVREPADERGIGMLSYSYDDPARDNETWLYLSALGRVKRIASGNSDDDSEPASLFGSEFTTEDTDTGKLDEYAITLLGEDVEGGRPVWLVELVPNAARARKTRYARTVNYIDKERPLALRADMYDQYGKAIKRLLAARVERVNGLWMARSLTIMNLVTNRLSNMAILEVTTGIEVADEFLTQRTLTDVAFRETELDKLRAQVE